MKYLYILTMMQTNIGLIGLAVMGQNLVLNMNDKGYSVVVYNRTELKTRDFLSGPAGGRENIVGSYSLEEFVNYLSRPRKIMIMVKAGQIVDSYLQQLLPLLSEGDIIIDGGNSHYEDTDRRVQSLEKEGILFVGCGVSGGEEGARFGPSMMPGGNIKAWPDIREILQATAAKTDAGFTCCDWIGPGGSGHFVKMVHNGIEYGDMQLICEAYDVMKKGFGFGAEKLHAVFSDWNGSELESYLIEITADIFTVQDDAGGMLLDKIKDTAGQKGTGKWTGINALELGVPVTIIAEAVFARALSSMKSQRLTAAEKLGSPVKLFRQEILDDSNSFLEDLRKALLCAKILSYTQGFMLLQAAAEEFEWDLDYGTISLTWREGCIIRSVFLEKIKAAYDNNPHLENLLLDDYFMETLSDGEASLRTVLTAAITAGIPLPAFSAALSFYDSYRSGRLPANLLQAQRDYFGAHTYERLDKPDGEFFHTDWKEKSRKKQ